MASFNYSYQTSTSYSSNLPAFIKKEDAPALFRRQRIFLSFISLGIAIILLAIYFSVSPRLTSLYADLGAQMSFLTQNAKYIVSILASLLTFFAYHLYSSDTLTQNFTQKLSRYNDGDSIKTTDLINTGYESILMLLIGLSVGFLITAIILPIYDLTSKV